MAWLICKSAAIYAARGKTRGALWGKGREWKKGSVDAKTLRCTAVWLAERTLGLEGMEAMEDLKEAMCGGGGDDG